MTNDILTRLREIAEPKKWQFVRKSDATAKEAADEIQRLREDRDRWRKIADQFYAGHVQLGEYGDDDMICIVARTYEQEIRSER